MGNCVSAKKIPQRDNYLDNYNGQFVPQVKFVDAYSVSQPETVSVTNLPDGIQNKNLSDKPRLSVQPSKENTNPHVVLGEVVSKHDVLYDYTHTHPDLASSLNTMMTIIELLANCSADVLADNKQLTQILSKVKLLGLFCSGEPENVKVFASFLADIDVVPVFKDVIQKLYNEHPAIVERNHGQNSAENYKVEDPAENDGLLGDTTDSENALVFIAQSIFDNLICAAHKLTSFHYALCLACREKGLVPILLEISKALAGNVVDEDWEPKNEDEATNIVTHIFYSTLGTLYNIARRTGPTHLFNDFRSFVPTLLTWATTKGAHFGTESILCLAYLIDEQNNHLIENQKGIIQFLVDTLDAALNSTDRKSFNFSASELAAGLSQLASNDTNKRTLGVCGAVKTLVKMIDTVKDKEEERSAATALWILAFDEQNKILIKREERALRLLHTLAKSSNSKVQKAAAGVLWEIEGRQARNQARRSGGSIDQSIGPGGSTHQSIGPGGSTHQQQQQHVMISYQWDVQNVVKEVKNRLQAAGYSVWMDIDDMWGSTLESMAGAVEDACAFLVCVSQKYKDSPNCRSEAEYAFQMSKQIVPLVMEQSYQPDGWLGRIVNSGHTIDFSKRAKLGNSFEKLISALGEDGKVDEAVEAEETPALELQPAQLETRVQIENISKWKKKDVKKWLKGIGILKLRKKAQEKLDGLALVHLHELRKESPDYFYQCLKNDLGFTSVFDVFKFRDELERLLNS